MAHDFLFKFIVIGNAGVGKSCLVLQYCNQQFQPIHDHTIGVEFAAKLIDIDRHCVKLQIWDTAGAEAYASVTKCYYRGSAGVILVYDITNRHSFERIPTWLAAIREQCHGKVSILLLGNKSDLEHRRQVTTEEARHFAKEHELMFREVTARNFEQVNEAITTLATVIYHQVLNREITPADHSGVKTTLPQFDKNNNGRSKAVVKLHQPPPESRERCCWFF